MPARRRKSRPRRRRRSKYCRPYRKRRYGRKRRRRTFAARTIPKKMLVQLTWCEDVIIPNQSANLNQVFALNSIFRPDQTTTPVIPHQPRGKDEWARLYSRYCVVGATVNVKPLYTNVDGGNSNTTLVGHLDDSPAVVAYPVSSIIELGMRGKSKYLQIGSPLYGIKQRGGGSLNWKVGMKKFFGVKKSTQVIFPSALGLGDDQPLGGVASDGMTAAMSASPVNICYLKLAVDDINANAAAPVLKARVTIRYTCVLYDPPEIGPS